LIFFLTKVCNKENQSQTCIKRSPLWQGKTNKPVLRGHLCDKENQIVKPVLRIWFSLSQRWPLNTGLTIWFSFSLRWPLNTGLTIWFSLSQRWPLNTGLQKTKMLRNIVMTLTHKPHWKSWRHLKIINTNSGCYLTTCMLQFW
jgi:hypothetical protein